MATGVNETLRQVGVAMGTAIRGAFLRAGGSSEVASLFAGTPAGTGGRPPTSSKPFRIVSLRQRRRSVGEDSRVGDRPAERAKPDSVGGGRTRRHLLP